MFSLSIGTNQVTILRRLYWNAYRKHRKEWFSNLREIGNLLRKESMGKLRTGNAGPDRESGTLIRSHAVVIRREPGTKKDEEKWQLLVGPRPGGNAFYGKFHELGVIDRNPGGPLLGRPWLAPTLAENENKITRMMGKSLRHIERIR